jgi:hypothetical protein
MDPRCKPIFNTRRKARVCLRTDRRSHDTTDRRKSSNSGYTSRASGEIITAEMPSTIPRSRHDFRHIRGLSLVICPDGNKCALSLVHHDVFYLKQAISRISPDFGDGHVNGRYNGDDRTLRLTSEDGTRPPCVLLFWPDNRWHGRASYWDLIFRDREASGGHLSCRAQNLSSAFGNGIILWQVLLCPLVNWLKRLSVAPLD